VAEYLRVFRHVGFFSFTHVRLRCIRKEMSMKRSIPFVGAATLAATVLVLANSRVVAGRVGGSMSTAATVALGNSVYYDIPFACNERANITVTAAGNAMVQVFVYDANGRVVMNSGVVDRKTVTIAFDVNRAGDFRVEVRNLANHDSAFALKTN
jgi:hypothetical protein